MHFLIMAGLQLPAREKNKCISVTLSANNVTYWLKVESFGGHSPQSGVDTHFTNCTIKKANSLCMHESPPNLVQWCPLSLKYIYTFAHVQNNSDMNCLLLTMIIQTY